MSKERIGIILAAGRGSRLKELSLEQPKPMITVNNVTIISNLVEHLIRSKVEIIIVIVGYKAERLIEHLIHFKTRVNLVFIENAIYDKTNNIYSLWLAKDYLKDGFFLFEADVFVEEAVVKDLVSSGEENVMVVDKYTSEMSGTVVDLNDQKKVLKMYLKQEQGDGFLFHDKFKTVNFYRISAELARTFFLEKLDYHIEHKDTNAYYELIIKEAIESNQDFYALETGDKKWYEIDTLEDLKRAAKIFT